MKRSNLQLKNLVRSMSGSVSGVLLALFLALGVTNQAAAQAAVECFVYNDAYTDMAGPSDAILFSGPNQVCIPDGTATGTCRKWFGRCRTVGEHVPVQLYVTELVGNERRLLYSDSVYSPGAGRVCIPDGTASGTCRREFGFGYARGGRYPGWVGCSLFNDGYTAMVGGGYLSFRGGWQVCDTNGTCRKWFGRCSTSPDLL